MVDYTRWLTDYYYVIGSNIPKSFKDDYGFTVSCKLFRKKALDGIRFKPINYGEDTLFMIEVMNCQPKMVLAKYVNGYFYYQHKESAIHCQKESYIRLDHLHYIKKLYDISVQRGFLEKEYRKEYVRKIHILLSILVKENDREHYKECRKFILDNINFALKDRICFEKALFPVLFYRVFPTLFWHFYRFIKKVH